MPLEPGGSCPIIQHVSRAFWGLDAKEPDQMGAAPGQSTPWRGTGGESTPLLPRQDVGGREEAPDVLRIRKPARVPSETLTGDPLCGGRCSGPGWGPSSSGAGAGGGGGGMPGAHGLFSTDPRVQRTPPSWPPGLGSGQRAPAPGPPGAAGQPAGGLRRRHTGARAHRRTVPDARTSH